MGSQNGRYTTGCRHGRSCFRHGVGTPPPPRERTPEKEAGSRSPRRNIEDKDLGNLKRKEDGRHKVRGQYRLFKKYNSQGTSSIVRRIEK